MGINTIAYGEVLQKKLDERMVVGLTSGWMDQNAGQVIYDGGNQIKMPKIETSGLKDYDRVKGYPDGSVTLQYETYEMTMDRSTSFLLDSMDVNESNFVANATNVSSTFQNEHVIPEVDAYRYSKLFAILLQANRVGAAYTPTASDVFGALLEDIAKVRDEVGEEIPLVISISGRAKALLDQCEAFKKVIVSSDFKSGVINLSLKQFDNNFIRPVPSSRMKSAYLFKDGTTVGEEAGGFVAADSAVQINWIITPQKAPVAVTKQEKMKIIDPDTYQKADAWFMGYRRYHDLWLPTARLNKCYANAQGQATPSTPSTPVEDTEG